MPKVIVKTGTTQDGEFDLDLTKFSWRERAFIADVAGVTPVDYAKKWFSVDPKTVVATIAVMMQRAGRDPDLDVLFDAPEESFILDYSDLTEQEDEAGPPAEASPQSDDASGERNDENDLSG